MRREKLLDEEDTFSSHPIKLLLIFLCASVVNSSFFFTRDNAKF
jgi:hypothetical protein